MNRTPEHRSHRPVVGDSAVNEARAHSWYHARMLAETLLACAPNVLPEIGETLAGVAEAMSRRDAWSVAALRAIGADRRTARRRATSWEPWTIEDDDERRAYGLAHDRAAKRILAAASHGAARAIAFSLSADGEATLWLLRAACGLPTGGGTMREGELYVSVLAPAVTSPASFAAYLVGYLGGPVGADELAHAVFEAKARGVLRAVPRDEMEERLDRWLSKRAPHADPRKAAVQVMVALGMTGGKARALVAGVPRARSPKISHVVPTASQPPTKPIRSPWLREIVALPAREARAALARRWKDVPRWLRPLRDSLVTSEIVGVTEELLELHHARTDRRYWVAPPLGEREKARALRALGFPPEHLLGELAGAFDGLRDWPPAHAGGLVPIAETTTLDRARRQRDAWILRALPRDEIEGMRDAAIVYEAGTGDILLASPHGAIAWARHGENVVEPAGRSLADFVAGWGTY
jgi:hypothetical protein